MDLWQTVPMRTMVCGIFLWLVGGSAGVAAPLRGEVVDADTGTRLPARVYVHDAMGRWYGVNSVGGEGTAIFYGRTNWINPESVETHTTISAHPFEAELPAGVYTVIVERGHEYRSLVRRVELAEPGEQIRLELRRWVNMAQRGWFSGDTHVHRTLEDLPNVMLAEDLNVSFPLVYWVTKAYAAPAAGDKSLGGRIPDELVRVDETHVIWPRNTEWEIFTVEGKRHTLGAVFALGHRSALTQGAPPVRPIAEQARREGALLDLDKHNWPWSIALIPVMDVDLYELANNHMWRTAFAFTNWARPAPGWMNLPSDSRDGGERAWVDYTLQTYYALLNCGFRMRPTAGTANGVHPVPLGFGRVYVRLPDGFDYPRWFNGLNAGRSFVTTGPMLLAEFNGKDPGARFSGTGPVQLQVSGKVLSQGPLRSVELVMNGEVVRVFAVENAEHADGGTEHVFDETVTFNRSGWLAVRCWEERSVNAHAPGLQRGRQRFAHTAPVYVDLAGKPLVPKRAEAEFLVQTVKDELARSEEVLGEEALAEYRLALARYEEIAERAE